MVWKNINVYVFFSLRRGDLIGRSCPLGSPAIQVFIECIAGSKYMNTSLPRQFASCTREGLVFTGMHKSRYESSLHLICFLPRIKRGTTSTGMTKYHCLLNINNINKLIMQNSVANWKLKGIPSQKKTVFFICHRGVFTDQKCMVAFS